MRHHQFDNLQKMKGLIFVLLSALTFVTVVYGENNFNSFYFLKQYLNQSFENMLRETFRTLVIQA